ncbi:MAG: hypothetical protein KDA21_03725 [Phycisphaerales bacterium]|nr:hypothetical protein [Phycisphaerales bacterium]
MSLRSGILISALAAAALLAGPARADNREAWPRLWSQPYIAGESAAVLHEEVAPGIWTVYLRTGSGAPDTFAPAGILQELQRIDDEGVQTLDASYRVGDAGVQGTLDVETAFVAAEMIGGDTAVTWYTAIVSTIHYELTIGDTVRSYRLSHLDLMSEHGSAAAAVASLQALVHPAPVKASSEGAALIEAARRTRRWDAALTLDPDHLQLCLQGAASCITNDTIEGRLNILCCVSALLGERAKALEKVRG